MTLNDKDLTRIKAGCLLSIEEHGNEEAKEIMSLIERLEAAECALETLTDVHNDCSDGECAMVLEEWRKAAGQ